MEIECYFKIRIISKIAIIASQPPEYIVQASNPKAIIGNITNQKIWPKKWFKSILLFLSSSFLLLVCDLFRGNCKFKKNLFLAIFLQMFVKNLPMKKNKNATVFKYKKVDKAK